ncbi:formyl transferase [Gongronella butleri]|nr:formyl transferase [Gongronella butleri]
MSVISLFASRRVALGKLASIRRPCQRYQSTSQRLRVLFFGTDDFASTHLKALAEEQRRKGCISSLELVCPPDRRTGRKLETLTPSATKGVAESYGVPVHHTPAQAKSLRDWPVPQATDGLPFDLGVVVSFGYFIPPHVISAFQHGAINVHPSLLPKFRGAAPIQHAILQGEQETGVTVQELDDKEFDAGRILAQTTVNLARDTPSYKPLAAFLANIGQNLLLDTLRHFDERKRDARVQDVSQATKAPKIKKEWADLDFGMMASWQVEQLYRAIGEQYPLRTTFTVSRVKPSGKVNQTVVKLQLFNIFLPTESPLHKVAVPPGTFVYDAPSQSLHIACADGDVVGVPLLKAENKRAISAKDFVNGYDIKDTAHFDTQPDPATVQPGEADIHATKKRAFYEKTIRKQLGLSQNDYNWIYKNISHPDDAW